MKRRLTIVMDVDESFYARLAADVADAPHHAISFSARGFEAGTNVYAAPVVSLTHEVIAEERIER